MCPRTSQDIPGHPGDKSNFPDGQGGRRNFGRRCTQIKPVQSCIVIGQFFLQRLDMRIEGTHGVFSRLPLGNRNDSLKDFVFELDEDFWAIVTLANENLLICIVNKC